MGLVASACLRCDDCINYHAIQSYWLGVSRPEQEEAINVALVVGGSIVIPHLATRLRVADGTAQLTYRLKESSYERRFHFNFAAAR